ncbi:hypothetical protein ACETK8_16230 [Brevundimonas staleyi]|uniref:IPTL-CTERM protein sorting domain-containing protein n=1 Tax=Brevundimonas staleyi TaxID=74326 RepID=A0ABW0FUR2_9CAUL
MTKTLKRTATLGAVAWVVLMSAGPALTQAVCAGVSQTFASTLPAGSTTDPAQPFSWVAPAGVTSVVVRARGAEGGLSATQDGGLGAEVLATYSVTPGERLCIVAGVKGAPAPPNRGAGGGGGSFVFSSGSSPCVLSNATLASLRVAAAGGGGAYEWNAGLPGRATGLGVGISGAVTATGAAGGGLNGSGGSADVAGGGGGGGGLFTNGIDGVHGRGGRALTQGAEGGDINPGGAGLGGFGGGGAGGGGGGYNGGGGTGGGSGTWPGGGGGSYTSAAPTSATDGVRSGNGEVTLCYMAAPPAAVPTLTEWAMIGLTGLLALCGLAVVERRRRFPASAV